MRPMNFTEWLKYQQNLLEISMEIDGDYSDGMETPNKELTSTANRIVAKNPNVIGKLTTASSPKQAFGAAMKTVTGAQPHLNVNNRRNLQIGDLAKAVSDVAGVKTKGV